MNNLYANINNLCISKNMSIGKLCSEINVSRGNLSDLKMGRIKSLSTNKLQKIADYFGTTVDYLLTGEESEQNEKPVNIEDDGLNRSIEIFKSLSSEQQKDVLNYMRYLVSQQDNK